MRKYTTLFFDLDNTLWDFDKNSREALLVAFNAFPALKNQISFDRFFDFYAKNNALMWDAYRKKEIVKKELIRKRFELTFFDCKISGIDPLAFNESYLEEMPNHSILVDGTLELLNHLKSKNYSMHIITNGFKEVQLKKLKNSGLSGYFEKIFISEIIKAPKPAVEIFEYALKSTNSKKQKSLMVGDSWEVDILGAMNAGIDQVHFVRSNSKAFNKIEQRQINSQKTNTFRVNSLQDLIGCL